MFAGGGEELHWSLTHLFDAMGALSTAPTLRRKPPAALADVSRDGFGFPAAAASWCWKSWSMLGRRGARLRAGGRDGHDMGNHPARACAACGWR